MISKLHMRMLELKCLASHGLEHCKAKNGNYFNILVWNINKHHDAYSVSMNQM